MHEVIDNVPIHIRSDFNFGVHYFLNGYAMCVFKNVATITFFGPLTTHYLKCEKYITN